MLSAAKHLNPAVLAELLRFAQNDTKDVRGLGMTSQQATLPVAIHIGIAALAMM
jgi:hypothetical protein